MAKSKLLQIWILKSEELDDEMRLKKSQNPDITASNSKKKEGGNVLKWEETASKNGGGPDTDKEDHEKINICQTCNFTTKYPGSLRHHKRKGCAEYKCNQCTDPKAFTKEELRKHKIIEHKFSPEPWLDDVCHICPATLDSGHTLRMHSSKGFSKEDGGFVCDTCKKLFEKKSDVRTHLKISFNCFRMQCPNCDFKTHIEKSFCRHKCEPKKTGNQIKCDECDFKDKSAAKVIEHTGVAHDGIVKKCDFCQFTSPLRSDLVKHSRVTHNVSHQLLCDCCPFVGKRLALAGFA